MQVYAYVLYLHAYGWIRIYMFRKGSRIERKSIILCMKVSCMITDNFFSFSWETLSTNWLATTVISYHDQATFDGVFPDKPVYDLIWKLLRDPATEWNDALEDIYPTNLEVSW